jgi:hypothetical protein
MNDENQSSASARLCTAFAGQRHIATGELSLVAREAKSVVDTGEDLPILIFDHATSALIELDFRGTAQQVLARLGQGTEPDSPSAKDSRKRSPGRPKLGVIAREVTLLPGHWDWLDAQAGGASAALRRLVHEAKKGNAVSDRARQSQEAVYKFMTVMAGDLPGFEEALRAFYRKNQARLNDLIKPWPKDIRCHVKKLVMAARHFRKATGTGHGSTGTR